MLASLTNFDYADQRPLLGLCAQSAMGTGAPRKIIQRLTLDRAGLHMQIEGIWPESLTHISVTVPRYNLHALIRHRKEKFHVFGDRHRCRSLLCRFAAAFPRAGFGCFRRQPSFDLM
jgi:hypothetical protein